MFFETIKLEGKNVFHIDYHQARFEKTMFENYKIRTKKSLKNFIKPPSNELLRCKIVYNKEDIKVEYFPYKKKIISSLKVVTSNLEYDYKYEDRTEINSLLKGDFDEVLITSNGYLKETSIANIALKIDNIYYTPKTPIFYGTTRTRLLDDGKIVEKELKIEHLEEASSIVFLNAMVGMYEVEMSTLKILRPQFKK